MCVINQLRRQGITAKIGLSTLFSNYFYPVQNVIGESFTINELRYENRIDRMESGWNPKQGAILPVSEDKRAFSSQHGISIRF